MVNFDNIRTTKCSNKITIFLRLFFQEGNKKTSKKTILIHFVLFRLFVFFGLFFLVTRFNVVMKILEISVQPIVETMFGFALFAS